MVSEYELNGVDCDPPPKNADALPDAFTGPFPRPRQEPLTDAEIRQLAADDDAAMATMPVPEIVRDVQAAGHCAECGSSLAQFTTIHIHQCKPYCPRCYHAEAGS